MSIKISQLQSFSLAGSGVSISDTTMTLSSFQTIDGVDLAMTDFGSKGYMTIEPGSRDREEQISFTGITQNASGTATLTGIKTVLFLSPYTETTGFSKSHPGGVVAVVTNTSGFYNEFGIKENDEILTGYWEAPDPLTTQGVATKNYVDNLVNGGTVSVSALIQTGTAGETVAAGNPVYLKASDGRWWKATGATAATVNVIQLGIAQGAGTAGNTITGGVLRRGTDTNQSGGAAGSIGYISDTSTISTSAGTTERAVGNFLTATTFNFDPDFYYIPTANQKAAFVGTSGTPSSTNKFVTNDDTSSSSSASKVVRAMSNGKISPTYLTGFGGTGADGALSITSGTTTVDLGSAAIVEKNYTSISITGTGVLAFSNPNTNGTIIVLKSQGDVTLTSSATPMIDATLMGGAGGTAVTATANGNSGSPAYIPAPYTINAGANGTSAAGGAGGAVPTFAPISMKFNLLAGKYPQVFAGAGGASGSAGASKTSGAGGRGAGGLIIECGGSFNFTTASGISVAGANGGNASGGGTEKVGGGGGGGGGYALIVYNTLTANSGSITVTGGTGGTGINGTGNNGGGGGGGSGLAAGTDGTNGSSPSGGNGGTGGSLVTANTEFA